MDADNANSDDVLRGVELPTPDVVLARRRWSSNWLRVNAQCRVVGARRDIRRERNRRGLAAWRQFKPCQQKQQIMTSIYPFGRRLNLPSTGQIKHELRMLILAERVEALQKEAAALKEFNAEAFIMKAKVA